MEIRHIPAVHKLLAGYLSQFNLAPVMNEEEVQHWLLPQENIIDTYIVEVRELHRGPAGGEGRSLCADDVISVRRPQKEK